MSETAAAFTGRVPEIYERDMGPVFFEPYARDIVARAAAHGPRNVLETAAGTGRVTRALIAELPLEVRITATDLNPDMLAIGAQLAADDRTVWSVADAQALPFADASFDLVLTQFGVMFYPDKPKGLAEAFRVLQPGGTFIFNVWGSLDDNPFAKVLDDELQKLFPSDPPQFMRKGPFGWSDTGAFVAMLVAAGFEGIAHEGVALSSPADAAVMVRGMCEGSPMRAELEARDATGLPKITATCLAAVEARFGPKFDLAMLATVYTARKPG